jgi:hypothetical protein
MRKIYVGNLPFTATEDLQLARAFARASLLDAQE